MSTSPIRKVVIALSAVGTVAAVGATVAAWVLTDIYMPRAPGVVEVPLPSEVRRSESWTDWYGVASAVLVLSAIGTLAALLCLVVVARRRRRPTGTGVATTVAALVASGTAIIGWLTAGMVEWSNLALAAVTVGTDISGYWTAAFDDGVRFVLVDSTEVSQGAYATILVTHLAAPIFAGVALAAVAFTTTRSGEVSIPPRQ